MNFKGKTAFVTGAGKGIGRAISVGLASLGANLVIADINEEILNETELQVKALGVEVRKAVFDVSDEDAVTREMNAAVEQFGQIHILVNNAGIYKNSDFVESTSDNWKKYIDVNILGTMYPTHKILPHMIEKGYGRIINIGSVAGEYGLSYFVEYSMTKGAIISFTKALVKLVTEKGITVNCVSPGSIDVTGGNNPMSEHSFMGRAGTPEECANLVIFLASDEASYVSGQNYLVDGCRKKM
jgi:NAD(P)-dependent dehydrogenase (short-subunit alcohol dehydrogenase family)